MNFGNASRSSRALGASTGRRVAGARPSELSLYKTPPDESVSLDEFELLAVERLRVLSKCPAERARASSAACTLGNSVVREVAFQACLDAAVFRGVSLSLSLSLSLRAVAAASVPPAPACCCGSARHRQRGCECGKSACWPRRPSLGRTAAFLRQAAARDARVYHSSQSAAVAPAERGRKAGAEAQFSDAAHPARACSLRCCRRHRGCSGPRR